MQDEFAAREQPLLEERRRNDEQTAAVHEQPVSRSTEPYDVADQRDRDDVATLVPRAGWTRPTCLADRTEADRGADRPRDRPRDRQPPLTGSARTAPVPASSRRPRPHGPGRTPRVAATPTPGPTGPPAPTTVTTADPSAQGTTGARAGPVARRDRVRRRTVDASHRAAVPRRGGEGREVGGRTGTMDVAHRGGDRERPGEHGDHRTGRRDDEHAGTALLAPHAHHADSTRATAVALHRRQRPRGAAGPAGGAEATATLTSPSPRSPTPARPAAPPPAPRAGPPPPAPPGPAPGHRAERRRRSAPGRAPGRPRPAPPRARGRGSGGPPPARRWPRPARLGARELTTPCRART